MTAVHGLPEPYADGTAQDMADMLRDHAGPRIGGSPLDFAAPLAADLIVKQAAEIARMRAIADRAVDWYVLGEIAGLPNATIAQERDFDAAGDRLEAAVIAYKGFPPKKENNDA